MKALLDATERSGARLVLIGDAGQIQPIEAGGAFPEMTRRLGAVELTEIRRQREAWARQAVRDFARGEAGSGLRAYAERGLLTVADDRQSAMEALIKAWRVRGVRSPEDQLIFTGTREEALILNRMAQAERQQAGALGQETLIGAYGDAFHVGDRVLFMQKSRLFDVENGTLGQVVGLDQNEKALRIRTDSGERVRIPLEQYEHLRLGYAMTTHKGQGATVDRAFILAGGAMQDRHISYVQTSRSRGETRLFVDRYEAGEKLTSLVRQMSLERAKEMAHTVQEQNSQRHRVRF